MNALTTTLTPLAVQNATLLGRLADDAPFDTLADLARETDIDRSNLNRKLTALEGEGLVERLAVMSEEPEPPASKTLRLTDFGRAAVAAIQRANGDSPGADGVAGTVLLTHDVIAFDGDNARTHSGLSPLEIEDMAASIRDRHAAGRPGLITPPTVRANPPLREDTGWPWILVHGERRLRGWRLAIERGWLPADTAFPCPVFTGDDIEATEEALVENLQRVDLDNLEAAEGLRKLSDKSTPPATAADIARRLGKEERWVEERLKVAREAEPVAKQRYRAWVARSADPDYDPKADDDVFRWTNLRNSVKKPRHLTALEKNPRLAMLIVELASASEARHGFWDGPVPVKAWTPGAAVDDADRLGLVAAFVSGSGPALSHDLVLLAPATDWLAATGFGDDPDTVLETLRRAALGDFGFAALADGQWASDLLNLPDIPIAADPAPQGDLTTLRPGLTGDDFSRQIREAVNDGAAAGDGGAAEPDGPAPTAAPDSSQPQPSGAPPSDSASLSPRAAQDGADPSGDAHPPASTGTAGSTPGDGSQDPAAGASLSPLDALTPLARLALLETALAVRQSGQETRGGGLRGAPLQGFHNDPTGTWTALFTAKLVVVAQAAGGGGFLAVLTDTALAALAADYPEGVTTADADRAAGFAGASLAPVSQYITPWLNPAPKRATEPRSPHSTPSPAQSAAAGPPSGSDEAAGAPGRPTSDPVINGMREAAADLWHVTIEARRIFDKLIDGDGAGDDELAAASRNLQSAAMAVAPYLTAEQKAAR